MSDWADEAAKGMTLGGKFLAQALRKAKADGFREAAELANEAAGEADYLCGKWSGAAAMMTLAASKIEKGEE